MTNFRKIQTIIWDLDGTLIDSFGVFTEAMRKILPKYGKVCADDSVIAANYHGPLEDGIIGAAGGALEPSEVAAIKADFLLLQDSQYAIIEGHLFKDAEDLARRAHQAGITQIIVTNRDHEGRNNASPRSIVANSELKNYIDLVICGDDGEHRKPRPEVLGDFVFDPKSTLVIGDQFVDVELAHNIGTDVVLIARNGNNPPHLDKLSHDWKNHVTIVQNLDTILI